VVLDVRSPINDVEHLDSAEAVSVAPKIIFCSIACFKPISGTAIAMALTRINQYNLCNFIVAIIAQRSWESVNQRSVKPRQQNKNSKTFRHTVLTGSNRKENK
jgi:hypothetical protein